MTPVQDVIARIDRMHELGQEIQRIEAAKAQLPELERELRAMRDGLIKTLEHLDVHSRGNMGWEGRTIRFLTMLRQEAVAAQPIAQEQASDGEGK